jgi:hypothetical protein
LDFLILENGTNTLSRNVGKGLPHDAALYRRRAEISSASRRKTEVTDILTVFENRVLRRIFGPKRDEATGEWRRLHNKELDDLYSSPNVIRVIKSRRMRWAGHVARVENREVA